MLKYTLNGKQTLADLMTRSPTQYANPSSSQLDPKYLPTPHHNALTPRKANVQMPSSTMLPPKTPRASYDNRNTSSTSYTRLSHLTPDKESSKKEPTYTTPVKYKKLDLLETSLHNQNSYAKADPKSARTDRSQRNTKSNVFKDMGNRQTDKQYLRQTVSNTYTSDLKRNMAHSPIKVYSMVDREKDSTAKEQPQFRKKNASELVSLLPSDNYFKDIKSAISSKPDSRKSTEYNYEDSAKGLEKLTFKSKVSAQNEYTPRVSQDKLFESKIMRNDKLMSQTDPSGSYFNLATSKRVSTQPIKRQAAMEPRIQDFQLGPCKGEGRFGKVYPAIHKKSGWMVAIKQIKKEEVRLMLDQFVQQIKINLFADHPNIVKMYGFFSDRTYFYIMMEYMEEGSLYKAIKVNKKLKEEEACQKLYQICDAVHYLHTNDILHRDIKPQNIVLSNGVSKLCDFGWATYSKERRNTYCGTLDYVCPEILEGQSYDNFVDIWAIGVLAYEMLIGKAPFYHISRKQTMKSILGCEFSFPSQISVNAKYFIKKALKKNPDERFTIQSLLTDRFLSGYQTKN